MESAKGVGESRELTTLQWQLLLKCWKFNLQPGQYVQLDARRVEDRGAAAVGDKAAPPQRTELYMALVMFSGLIPERLLQKYHKSTRESR